MKKRVVINNIEYELIKDYKDGFIIGDAEEKVTDYFEAYDYILGDWAYGKLRLKGFCDKSNKIYNKSNDYRGIEKYIRDFCSYDCKYFILQKIDTK